MLCLSFTARAERRGAGAPHRPRPAPPPRHVSPGQVALTWLLLVVWAGLMTFGVISLIQPPWLRELGRPGRAAEAENYKHYGDTLAREGKLQLAIAQYEYSLKIDPDQPAVRLNLAVACMQLGQAYWPRAEQLLAQTLEADPWPGLKAAVHYNFGELRERQGRHDEALRHYEQALETAVEKDRVYRKLAALHLLAGRYQAARAALTSAIEIRLDPTRPYLKMLQATIDDSQKDAAVLTAVTDLLARGATPEQLAPYDLEVIRQTQQSDPDLSVLYDNLGAVCAQLQDYAAAREYFARALEIFPGNRDARKNLERLEQRLQPRP